MKNRYELRGSVIVDTHTLSDLGSYEILTSLKQVVSVTEAEEMEYDEDTYNYETEECFKIFYLNNENTLQSISFESSAFEQSEVQEYADLMKEYLTRKKKKEIFEKIVATSPFLSVAEAGLKATEMYELYVKEKFSDLA